MKRSKVASTTEKKPVTKRQIATLAADTSGHNARVPSTLEGSPMASPPPVEASVLQHLYDETSGRLSDEAKRIIVELNACYQSPMQVARWLKEHLGIEISRQAVEKYDPTKAGGKKLSAEYQELFAQARATYLEQIGNIGIAHQKVRLDYLQRMCERAYDRGNDALALQILKQAAEEVGGAFTNRREVSGPNGGPIATDNTNTSRATWDISKLDDEELETLERLGHKCLSPAPLPTAK